VDFLWLVKHLDKRALIILRLCHYVSDLLTYLNILNIMTNYWEDQDGVGSRRGIRLALHHFISSMFRAFGTKSDCKPTSVDVDVNCCDYGSLFLVIANCINSGLADGW